MSFQLWLWFVLVSLLADLSPGPAVMLAVALTLGKNFKEGVKAILGLQAADVIWSAVAVAAILSSYKVSSSLLNILEIAGAVYLIYAGLGSFITVPDIFSFLNFGKKFSNGADRSGEAPAFLAGLITNLANPKCYLYWLAFLPQFQPASGPTLGHNLWLIAVANITTMPPLLFYAYSASRSRRLFAGEDWRYRLERISGGVLIILGIWMLARYFNFME